MDDTNSGWLDWANWANATALTWYNTIAGNQYYQPQTGVVVASPYGTTAFTASPLVWLLLIALAIYLMRR